MEVVLQHFPAFFQHFCNLFQHFLVFFQQFSKNLNNFPSSFSSTCLEIGSFAISFPMFGAGLHQVFSSFHDRDGSANCMFSSLPKILAFLPARPAFKQFQKLCIKGVFWALAWLKLKDLILLFVWWWQWSKVGQLM